MQLIILKLFNKQKFDYNLTRESEFEELKDRNRQLEEENMMLKRSLEELIKVNSELTESIEEFNNSNYYQQQNNDEFDKRFQMLLNQHQKLKTDLEDQTQKNHSIKRKSQINDDRQTQSLVNVLEELIESFKNIQTKYESEILELQRTNEGNSNNFESMLRKLEQQLSSKINTVDELSLQLKIKDELLTNIEEQFKSIEQTFSKNINLMKQSIKSDFAQDKSKLQFKMEAINRQLDEKNRIIQLYEKLISNLKGKIMQKY